MSAAPKEKVARTLKDGRRQHSEDSVRKRDTAQFQAASAETSAAVKTRLLLCSTQQTLRV
eukprot:2433012-Pleurochrysis_carterae.AAC.2